MATILVFACLGAACTPATAARMSVAVVVSGPHESVRATRAQLAEQPVAGVALQLVAPAAATLESHRAPPVQLGEVRSRYLAADVDGCLALVDSDAALEGLLVRGDRSTAARMLFWRVACHLAAEQSTAADAAARTFAALGLAMPADARDASPDVENCIDRALQRVANETLDALVVESNVESVVHLDGLPEGCPTPCTLHAAPGFHVVRIRAEGHLEQSRRVRLESPRAQLSVTLAKAPPKLAAAEWQQRYAGTALEQSASSARLLAMATPARYLVLLTASSTHTRGLLFFDADVRARAERSGPHAAGAVVDELLHRGKLIESKSVLKSPWFWLSVVGAAAAAATLTFVVLQSPEQRTEVRIR